MNRHYQAIALDMDGTVLNSHKEIDPPTSQAIHDALEAGKEVIFCTGRSYSEMEEILEDFPNMHYLCGESGALLFDLVKKEPLACRCLSPETFSALMDISRQRNLIPFYFSEGRDYIDRKDFPRLAEYGMEVYIPMFSKVSNQLDDIYEESQSRSHRIEKLLLFHNSAESRAETMEQLQNAGVKAALILAEESNIECSAPDVSKATGLSLLSEKAGIPMDEIIMVGDADNDLAALQAVGLAVAMGNANDNVKAVSHAIVADNDHNGCAEAIYRFLLGKSL